VLAGWVKPNKKASQQSADWLDYPAHLNDGSVSITSRVKAQTAALG
jgi:hypothetical protein